MNRREILKNSGILAGAAATHGLAADLSPAVQDSRKFKVIITGGHPGDPEYGCGGTVARLTAQGHDVVLLYANNGQWETSAEIRMAEAKKACDILKSRPAYAGQANGHSIVDDAHYESFHKIIVAESPDAIFIHWPIDSHPDHRAIANLAFESWNRVKRSFPLYYYEVSNGGDTMDFAPPTHYVDISAVADVKKAACYAHASQNPDFFYGVQDTVAAFRGLTIGCKRAEAFILQSRSPFDLLKMAGLSPT